MSVPGVAFRPTVPVAQTRSPPNALEQQVLSALEGKADGDAGAYEQLVFQVRQCQDTGILARFIAALRGSVAVLAKHHKQFPELFAFLFSFDWSGTDEFAQLFHNLVTDLVSADSYFVTPAYQMLVGTFVKDVNPKLVELESGGAAAMPPLRPVNSTWVHNTIKRVAWLVPSGGTVLRRALATSIPHPRLPPSAHEAFLRNALCVLAYAPAQQTAFIPVLTRHLVEIDVEIVVEGPIRGGAAGEAEAEAAAAAAERGAPPAAVSEQTLAAEKLDVMMDLTFEFLADRCKRCDEASLSRLFLAVYKAFEATVLRTHRSKYTQFLLFYLAHARPAFTDRVVGSLVNRVTGAAQSTGASSGDASASSTLSRRYSAAYLASFLARAAYAPDSTIRSALFYLLSWLHAYLDNVAREAAAAIAAAADAARRAGRPLAPPPPPQAVQQLLESGEAGYARLAPALGHDFPGPGTAAHAPFYTAAQCVFYTLCFRAESLCAVDGGTEFLAEWRWRRLLGSVLDPLKYCLPSVAREFLRTARATAFVPQSVLAAHAQRWLRPAAATAATAAAPAPSARPSRGARGPPGTAAAPAAEATAVTDAGAGDGAEPAPSDAVAAPEAFFPFDPYLLNRSSRHLSGLYLFWAAGDDASDSDSVASASRTLGAESDSDAAQLSPATAAAASAAAAAAAVAADDDDDAAADGDDARVRGSRRRPLRHRARRRRRSSAQSSLGGSSAPSGTEDDDSDSDSGSSLASESAGAARARLSRRRGAGRAARAGAGATAGGGRRGRGRGRSASLAEAEAEAEAEAAWERARAHGHGRRGQGHAPGQWRRRAGNFDLEDDEEGAAAVGTGAGAGVDGGYRDGGWADGGLGDDAASDDSAEDDLVAYDPVAPEPPTRHRTASGFSHSSQPSLPPARAADSRDLGSPSTGGGDGGGLHDTLESLSVSEDGDA